MKVFTSNHLPQLAEKLRQELQGKEKCWVIVPSEEVKLDLYLKWLETSDVITGIKTITYNELIRKMFPELPSKTELALRIETALDGTEEYKNYLTDHNRKLSLSQELSSLFLKYLQKPVEEILEWRKQEGWQQKLFNKLFDKTLPTSVIVPLKGSFFFYHISTITPYEWDAFSQMDTTWFMFSPSLMYLGDLLPERQQKHLLRKAKNGVKENLLEYFEHDSPLLSNWNVHGQNLHRYFEDVETEELFVEPTHNSALKSLHTEWLTLEKEHAACDLSIQLHSAPTILREVEVVWEIIQRLPFSPREIVVLAPDIEPYAASIEWVFKERGGPFNYSISGLAARTRSPLLQGFEILLSLPKHRFSREAFSKLLSCQPFLDRFNLKVEDSRVIDGWMSDLHLRYDLSEQVGSWHGTVKRAVEALVSSGTSFPIDFSDTPLINRWIEITEKLALLDFHEREALEWAEALELWIKTFFKSDEESDVLNALLRALKSEKIEGTFPFETIEHLLQSAFANPSGSIHKGMPETVRFTSIKQASLMRAKAILCMGMQEGSFPRTDPSSSLPLLPISNRIVEDRYLFLETISHAQEMLIFTYQRCHPDDGKEMHPSPLIQELAEDRRGITTIHHPLSALDRAYYQEEGFRSFSKLHFNLLRTRKTEPLRGSLSSQPKTAIDIRVLKKLSRHPVQCFLEEGLGVRFPWKESDSEFLLSPLEMHRLRKAALHQSVDELIDELSRQGKLPTGAFKSTAILSIEKEIGSYKNTLAQLGIDSIFSLELTPHAKTFTHISHDHAVAPSLIINGVQLSGVIEGVTPSGLLFHGDDSTEDLLKVWPLYLIVKSVLSKTSLFLTKKESALQIPTAPDALQRYISYLQKSVLDPSPLMPAWGRRLLKGSELPTSGDDEILLWAEKRNILPPSNEWIEKWRSYLQEVVRELI